MIRLESLRTIDRARIRLGLTDAEVSNQRALAMELLAPFKLIGVDSVVLGRAEQPFPTSLASLDAIHLASALAARERYEDLVLATHDDELALAARAVGFKVEGASV